MVRFVGSLLAAGLVLGGSPIFSAITVELLETVEISEIFVVGDVETSTNADDPIDADCPSTGKCVGRLTRDGSLDLDSRYGCTQPIAATSKEDDDYEAAYRSCNILYRIYDSERQPVKVSSVNIALHPDSVTDFNIYVDDIYYPIARWQAIPGTTEMQEISVLRGLEISRFWIAGDMDEGEYLGIIETEIYVDVDEVTTTGTPARNRARISATATTDAKSAMKTLDGDATDASSWTCSSGKVCEITYDLHTVESLKQLRIGISENTNAGGTFNFMAAGESGGFFAVRTEIEAGARPIGSDGLQTFGGVRALARYVKIEAVPARGGVIGITEVEFRVGEDKPQRPVRRNARLEPTGPIPYPSKPTSRNDPNHDIRTVGEGGCDSPEHFEGCHIYYIKDGDRDMDSRWSCGPLAPGATGSDICAVKFNLNNFRYVRQIQFAFHMADEQHHEFAIEAYTLSGWVTVVPSAITSGTSTGFQTFDVAVHSNTIRLFPKFRTYNTWFSIIEMVILEDKKESIAAGILPVFAYREFFANDDDDDEDADGYIPTEFEFDLPAEADSLRFTSVSATITDVRIKFPANEKFVFSIKYDGEDDDIIEEFTSAGGKSMWETFTFTEVAIGQKLLTIAAVSGPSLADFPTYPTVRVVGFQIVGEPNAKTPGRFEMVSTTTQTWDLIPDIIGDGVSDQLDIMTAICETKGATFDGTDCVGELNDDTVYINIKIGVYYVDGPVFIKSGVTLSGGFNLEYPSSAYFYLYEGSNNGNTVEDGMIVVDGVADAKVSNIDLTGITDPTGDIVPGTVGNFALDVRDSQDLEFHRMDMDDTRTGGARFVDSANISVVLFNTGKFETGNYMNLIRVQDFAFEIIPSVRGLLIEDCHNIYLRGVEDFDIPYPELLPSSSGDQPESVVITGDSSGIVFQDLEIEFGTEPRIRMESTEPLTLDHILDYQDAVSGECIIQVPEGTTDDLIVQVNADQTLSKSGNCWVFD